MVVVTGTGPGQRSADGSGPDFSPLKDEASLAGTAIEIGTVPGVTRLAWGLPFAPVRGSPSDRPHGVFPGLG